MPNKSDHKETKEESIRHAQQHFCQRQHILHN